MSEWEDLLASEELLAGFVVEAHWQGHDLLLFRGAGDRCHAVTAYCPHMGNYIPNGLAQGCGLTALLVENEIRCPYHGWRFSGDGLCTHIPQGQRVPIPVRQGRPVARYWRLREIKGRIQIAEPESGE